MQTTDQQVRSWADEAQTAFLFLEQRGYKLESSRLDVVWGSITYLGPMLGVRLEVETDDFTMYLALFRPGHADHENSEYLQTCLNRLGLSLSGLQQMPQLRGEFANLGLMLALYSNSLQSNIGSLEKSVGELFPK